jgi:opacity protein-like surface antigen
MKKALLATVLLLLPLSAFAQDWRNRPAYRGDSQFELTPFVGYRYGGTLRASQVDLFSQDVDIAGSADFGVSFAIPLSREGLKLELMASHQSSHFRSGGGSIFAPGDNLGDVDINYYHAGLLFPFAQSRTITPYVVVSAGVANISPQLANVEAANRFSASAGIGLKVPVNPSVSIRVEARGYYTSLGGNDNCARCSFENRRDLTQGETNVGLAFNF